MGLTTAFRRLSVAGAVIAILVTLTTVAMGVAGAYNYNSLKESELDHFKSELKNSVSQLASGLAIPLWNMDDSLTFKIVESSMSGAIAGVVLNAEGKVHYWKRDAEWKPIPSESMFPEEGLVWAEQPISFRGRALGSVRVYATQVFAGAQLRYLLVSTAASILIIDAMLVVGLYLSLRTSIILPLRRIEQYAQSVSSGGSGGETVRGGRFRGELEGLRRSVEKMYALLQSRYEALGRQAAFDGLIADLLGQFVDCPPSEIDERITAALAKIGSFLKGENVYVIVIAEDRNSWRVTHSWTVGGRGGGKEAFRERPFGVFPWVERRIMAGEPVLIKDVAVLPPEGEVDRREYLREGITAIMVAPTAGRRGYVTGCIGIQVYGAPESWTIEDAERLKILGSAIAGLLNRKEVEEQAARLTAAVEQSADEIIITDTAGRIQYVNPALERISGYSAREVIGQSPRVFQSGVHGPEFYQELWRTLEAGEVWKGRFHNLTRDGRRLLEDASIAPIRNSAGGISGYVAVRRDVTQQVAMETHMAQAQKMEALGTLAGGIAHDFNNILSAIMGFSEVLLFECPGEASRQSIRAVMRASGRAADLVRQILSFSRRDVEEARFIKPAPIIKEALKLMRALIPTTIEIRSSIGSDSSALADPGEIHRILVNLCTNASLAMKENGGILEVRLDEVELDAAFAAEHPRLNPGKFLRLTVSDTGSGMTEEVKSHIFEPFYTTRPQGEGTGMGLSVVHGIVSRRGGAISVASRPGEGTTFQIFLPAGEGVSGALPPEDETPEPGHERVLFVDDEPDMAQLAELALGRYGYKVTACNNGPEALERFTADPAGFDIVVSDMTMPGMTGDQLAARIHAIRPDIPIILCTGFSERMNAEKARGMGISDFILKPVAGARLSKAIRKSIDGSKAAAPADGTN